MDVNLIIIALSVSLLFEGSFFFALSLIYKAMEKKNLRFVNTFLFEVVPGFKQKYGYIDILLLFGIVITIAPYVYYGAYHFNTSTMMIMILSVLLAFCLSTLPFIPLNKLKEHYYIALGGLVSVLALYVMEGYYCIRLYRLYQDTLELVAMIMAFAIALLILIAVFNPKLFDLRNEKNDNGEMVRKKFIFLSFVEWMLYPSSILALVPILLVSI